MADSIKGTTNLGNTLINNFIQKVKSVPGGCRAVVTRALGGPIGKCEAIIKADPEKEAGKKRRTERLGKGKKFAGFSAGRLSDKLLADIRNLNQDILKMSDEEILANKKIINSMKVNANVNNLNKGIITFDKYNDLSPKELVKKIKDRAKQGIFWQPEHISSVKGEAKNIYYPNNLQAAPGNIGSFMENFKKIAKEDPNNPVLNEINTLLKDYNLTVRDPNTGGS